MTHRIIVIGAGAMGAWTALNLRRLNHHVTLVDSWGPGNTRASSGGDTRVVRAVYGEKGHYVEMVRRSLDLWHEVFGSRFDSLFVRTGLLWLVNEDDGYIRASLPFQKAFGFTVIPLTLSDLGARFPQISRSRLTGAYIEEDAGYILARRSCFEVTELFTGLGGRYVQRQAVDLDVSNGMARCVHLSDGHEREADLFVYACGPWLPQLFPDLFRDVIVVRRQEVFYFGSPAGNPMFTDERLPVWAEIGPPAMYGVPGSERRGFKVADDVPGPEIDPTSAERTPDARVLATVRSFLAQRFPAMAEAPLIDSRVCQYSMTPDRDLVLDHHPEVSNVLVAGGGSGHAFKLGPAIGAMIGDAVAGASLPEAFSLARFRAGGRRKAGGMFD